MSAFWQAWGYFKKHWFVFVFCFFLGYFFIFIAQVIPQVLQLILDKVIMPALGKTNIKESSSIFLPLLNKIVGDSADLTKSLITLVVLLLLLAFTRHITHYIRWNLAHTRAVDCERDLRNAAFRKIITQNSMTLNRYTSGELLSIAQSDVIMIKDMFIHYIPLTLESFMHVFLAVFFITRINWYLAILPLCVGVAMAITSRVNMKKMRQIYNEIRNRSIDLNSCVQENINGIRIVKAYAAEGQEIKKFDQRNENYKNAYFKHTQVWSKFNALFASFAQIAYLGSIIIAIFLGLDGKVTIGEFGSFVYYIGSITNPLINMSYHVSQLQQSLVCADRLFTFINTNNMIADAEDAISIKEKPNLAIESASLTIDNKPILTDINLELPYGKKLGIMGKTGSGKSSLLKLMTRFYDVTKGAVLINGADIRKIKLEDVRLQFGYVMQDVFLFSNTIDANIAFFNPDISHEEVIKAAKAAQAHDFIMDMPQGYDTIVGERGVGLSGGQKQRVSIARALLKDAPILLLDDATSALDLQTERLILRSLSEEYADKTLVITAHRAASVRFCDEIIYLEDGKIVERGTHEELMHLNGRYADIYKKQQATLREIA
ncbi:MAG TPA: ABC transporter ATP-binding protein [Clostridiales bacterium]|nr:ABC transporter ATP-binding protein [Clostridiales bacterium]